MTVFAGDVITSADFNGLADNTEGAGICRLIQQTAQALADNTAVAITFGSGSEDIDTDNWHSTTVNNTRITPDVEGYYEVSGGLSFEAETTPVSATAYARKNGTTNIPPAPRQVGAAITFVLPLTKVTVAMNGTTDYLELIGQQDSAGSDNTVASVQFASVLEVKFLRPL